MSFRSAPDALRNVAAQWRRSCSRIGGRPESATRCSKRVLTVSGWYGVPSGCAKNSPVSGQAGPLTSCQRARRAR
jgi:hypothetical protein